MCHVTWYNIIHILHFNVKKNPARNMLRLARDIFFSNARKHLNLVFPSLGKSGPQV